jgi:CHAT domain-containing protein
MARKRVTFFRAIQIFFLKSVGKIKKQSTQLFIILFVTVSLSLVGINVHAQSIDGRDTAMPCPEEGTFIVGTQQCLALKGGYGNAVSLQFRDAKESEKLARESYALGKFEESVKYWQQVISAYEMQGDWLNQAIALSNLSLTYQQLGRWQEAEKAIENSINLLPQESKANSAELKAIAQTFDIQGNLEWEQGQVNSALKTWEKSTNIYVKLKDELGRKRSLISQIKAMQELGLYEQACQALIPVIGLGNQGKSTTCEQLTIAYSSRDTALPCPYQSSAENCYNHNLDSIQLTGVRLLGDVLRKLGYLDKSRKLLETVEPLISQQNSPEEKALIWLSLGNTYEALANRNKFLSDSKEKETQNYNFALNFYQKVSNITDISQIKIQAQLNFFSLLTDEKSKNFNSKKVEDLHLEILSQLSKLPPSRQKVYAEVSLMKSLSKNNQAISSREIIELGEKAVKLAKDLDDGRATAYALGNLGKIYVQKKQWLEAQKFTEKALLLSQNVKQNLPDLTYQWQRQLGIILSHREEKNIESAIAAYTAAFNTLQSVRNDLVPISRDGQFDFRDEIEPVYRELVDLLLRGEKPEQKNLKQAREVIEALQVAELDNFFRDACVVVNKAEEIDKIADKYDPTAAVIHAIILPNRLAIILKLPGKKDLEYREIYQSSRVVKDTIIKLQNNLIQPGNTDEVKEESNKLYKWLIQPIESFIQSAKNVKTLVFILDRALQVIPMGVLYDGKQYLLEKDYDLALVPGLQLIDPQPWEKVQLGKLKVLTGGVDQHQNLEGIDFPKIEKLNEELKGIGNFVETTQTILNEDFTKTNLQKQLTLANIPIVHIKTHGEFSSDPEKTFIVAFGSLIKSKDLDNLIKTGNEKDRRSIELLVLSACKTAQGDERAALGLSGVAIRAGARSTVSTLWIAQDGANTEIMVRFYQELSKKGMTRAKALHIAQKAYFEKDKAPYFWAPYIIVGNWL